MGFREPHINLSWEKLHMENPTPSNGRSRMVTGLFRDRDSAERAYESLSNRGYSTDEVNLVMSDETRNKYFSDKSTSETELGTKAAEGAGIGGAIGGTLGAIAAGIAAVGTSIAVPGLGLVIAGPAAAALAGAGAGGAAGGLVGALVGWGMPEERVKHYEGRDKGRRYFVGSKLALGRRRRVSGAGMEK
jgi:hypothetical protein